jgi:hypothetical protein
MNEEGESMAKSTGTAEAIRELIAELWAISEEIDDTTVEELIEEGRRHPLAPAERARLFGRIADRLERRAEREGPRSAAAQLLDGGVRAALARGIALAGTQRIGNDAPAQRLMDLAAMVRERAEARSARPSATRARLIPLDARR